MRLSKKIQSQIDSAYWEVSRACDYAAYLTHIDAQRLRDDAIEIATKQERHHRRMGARFTDGRAQYRGSHETAARLIFAQHVIEALQSPGRITAKFHTLSDAESLRDDVRKAYVCAEAMLTGAKRRFPARDYAEDASTYAKNRLDQQKRLRAAIKALKRNPLADLDYVEHIVVKP